MKFIKDLLFDLLSWILVTVLVLGICIKLCDLI